MSQVHTICINGVMAIIIVCAYMHAVGPSIVARIKVDDFLTSVGMARLILHVDDDQSVRDSVSRLLRADGYETRSAASRPEALRLVNGSAARCPVDFNLEPQMNGAEVAVQIARILSYVPPIIMLTSNVSSARIPRNSEGICGSCAMNIGGTNTLAMYPRAAVAR